MMNRIYKYPLSVTDEQVVLLPTGAQILTVQAQCDNVCLWAMVNPTSPNSEAITIRIHGTGHEISDPERLEYINTFQLYNGKLVFHAFKIK